MFRGVSVRSDCRVGHAGGPEGVRNEDHPLLAKEPTLEYSVKKAFSKREQKPETETKGQEYGELLKNTGYSNYSSEKGKGENEVEFKKPYVISPEEFGEMNDYEKTSLTYYANGVLTDESDEIIYNIEETVGDALEHFGEYEDDSVFVRNEENMCDYEILLDQRNFSELTGAEPFHMEGAWAD